MVQLSYKYRIYPSPDQEEIIKKTFHAVRFTYNKLLETRTENYREAGKWEELDLKAVQHFSFLKGIDPHALEWAKASLETAYRNFFKTTKTVPDRYRKESIAAAQKDPECKLTDIDLVSYPRFKKKKTASESYTTTIKELSVQNNRFPLPYIGKIKIKYHRPVPTDARPICITILRKPSGNYFILIKFEIPKKPEKELKTPLGIALQPGRLAIRSDGIPVNFRHTDEQLQKRIDKAYQTLKRRKPGSKRYEKQRKYLASLYEHRANQRRDNLHKIARQITNAADAIYMEEPKVRTRLKSMKVSGNREMLLDEATWTFASFVKYKAGLDSKWFWSVPKEAKIHGICSNCYTLRKTTPRGNWQCSKCGANLRLYDNAAKNLENIGKQYIRNRTR